MGCGESAILNYTVQCCSLEQSKENTFIINLLAEEEFSKIEGLKFLNQIGSSNSPEIKKFLERPSFKENTIFYFFLGDEPTIKTFNQSGKYTPYNIPLLSKTEKRCIRMRS